MESIHVPALWTALRQTRNKAQGNFHPGFGTTLRIRCPCTMGSHRSLSGASTRQSAAVWGGVGGVGLGAGVGGAVVGGVGAGGVGGVGVGEGPDPPPMKSNLLVSSSFRSPIAPLIALARMDARTCS